MVYVFRDERDRLACLVRRTVERFNWQLSENYVEAMQYVVRFYDQCGRLPPLGAPVTSAFMPARRTRRPCFGGRWAWSPMI